MTSQANACQPLRPSKGDETDRRSRPAFTLFQLGSLPLLPSGCHARHYPYARNPLISLYCAKSHFRTRLACLIPLRLLTTSPVVLDKGITSEDAWPPSSTALLSAVGRCSQRLNAHRGQTKYYVTSVSTHHFFFLCSFLSCVTRSSGAHVPGPWSW